MTSQELQARFKAFSYNIVTICESLAADRKVSKVIEYQLLKSAFSASANYRAACKAQSPAAFKSKLSISFEEIDESLFWLESINDLSLAKNTELVTVIKEADELTRILAATRKKLEQKEVKQS